MMNLKAWSAVVGVFIGCCNNVIFLEALVKYNPASGNLITFSQFLFISIEGYIFTSKFGQVKPVIAFKDYVILVLMFFITSVCNNYAFNFNIPMPLHMIFRAGSLMANMIMGIILLKRTYPLSKYLAVLMITVGIAICTLISATKVEDTRNPKLDNFSESSYSVLFWWSIGIAILTVALLVSACMGIYQEVLYKKYGKRSREALYYTHLLPLPGFLLLGSNIWENFVICLNSEPLIVHNRINLYVPEQIIYLICNMITQYVCISSVYVLTAECTSLTVTLVVTLRKFASLLISILYFKNTFTVYHWLGTALVFSGTIIFTEAYPKNAAFIKRIMNVLKCNSVRDLNVVSGRDVQPQLDDKQKKILKTQ